jgi:hypothetical protein
VLRNEKFNEKCDVFSMGVVLWELISRKEPYAKMAPLQVIAAVVFQGQRLPQPTGCDPRLCDLIDRCWAPESETRPSFFAVQEILQGIFEDLVRGHAAGQRRTVRLNGSRDREIRAICPRSKSECNVGCAGDWKWELSAGSVKVHDCAVLTRSLLGKGDTVAATGLQCFECVARYTDADYDLVKRVNERMNSCTHQGPRFRLQSRTHPACADARPRAASLLLRERTSAHTARSIPEHSDGGNPLAVRTGARP